MMRLRRSENPTSQATPGAAHRILHHITRRSLAGSRLFQAEADCEDFLDRLGRLARAGHLQVYAWPLLPNHFHPLLRTWAQPLPTSMRQFLAALAVNFNRRHKRR